MGLARCTVGLCDPSEVCPTGARTSLGRDAVEIREGNRVMVNLAPFIGSKVRSRQSVSCRILAVDGDHLQVATEFPYRSVTLWIPPRWIESDCPKEAAVGAAF